MHVISRPTLTRYIQDHADAKSWLEVWWNCASKRQWHNLHEVREDYPSADQVNCCLIFNVKGNKYRLTARVSYANQWTRGTLLIKHFMTHAEYDKDNWKKDCS